MRTYDIVLVVQVVDSDLLIGYSIKSYHLSVKPSILTKQTKAHVSVVVFQASLKSLVKKKSVDRGFLPESIVFISLPMC